MNIYYYMYLYYTYHNIYRVEIQSSLPEIFARLGSVRRRITGRMRINQLDERIRRLFSAWEEWSILSPPFLLGLEAAYFESEADAALAREASAGEGQVTPATVGGQGDVGVGAVGVGSISDPEFDCYKRQAKLYGIYTPPNVTPALLKAKIEYYKRYESMKSQGIYIAPTASQIATRILSANGGIGGFGTEGEVSVYIYIL